MLERQGYGSGKFTIGGSLMNTFSSLCVAPLNAPWMLLKARKCPLLTLECSLLSPNAHSCPISAPQSPFQVLDNVLEMLLECLLKETP